MAPDTPRHHPAPVWQITRARVFREAPRARTVLYGGRPYRIALPAMLYGLGDTMTPRGEPIEGNHAGWVPTFVLGVAALVDGRVYQAGLPHTSMYGVCFASAPAAATRHDLPTYFWNTNFSYAWHDLATLVTDTRNRVADAGEKMIRRVYSAHQDFARAGMSVEAYGDAWATQLGCPRLNGG